MRIHNTHADVITIQETMLTPKAKTPKVHNLTTVRTDRLHKAGCGLTTVIRETLDSLTRPHSRANTCDPALTLLNEEITPDTQKQNIWKEHLDAHWDHRHNMHILWNTYIVETTCTW